MPAPETVSPTTQTPRGFGALLQHWRKARRMSQLALAVEADVSPRHVCFVETGRAKPSRDMVLRLSGVLDVPLRERNALLLAAGFAPMYTEATLDAPELGAVRHALDAMLAQQEPYPAVVLNRRWDILKTNRAADAFFAWLLGDARHDAPADPRGPNVMRLMFDPHGLRPHVTNWIEVAETLIQRTHREALGGVPDAATQELLKEVLAFPDVPARLRTLSLAVPLVPVIPVRFEKEGRAFSSFPTVTTLGSPQDITLQEIRIECFFPADNATAASMNDRAVVREVAR